MTVERGEDVIVKNGGLVYMRCQVAQNDRQCGAVFTYIAEPALPVALRLAIGQKRHFRIFLTEKMPLLGSEYMIQCGDAHQNGIFPYHIHLVFDIYSRPDCV